MIGFVPPTEQRPAYCFCCKRQLYFIGDSRHEPEYELIIKDHLKPHPNMDTYFVHADCWTSVQSFIKHFNWWTSSEKESS